MKLETPNALSATGAAPWKLLAITVLVMSVATAMTSAGRLVTAITPRNVEYILDADARNSTRDYDLVKGTVTVEYSGPLDAESTRLSVGLRDENDNWVTLVAGTNLTTTYNPGTLVNGQVTNHTFNFALDPDQQLDPGREYRVAVTIEVYRQLTPTIGNWLPGGLPVYGAPRRYFHFTNIADTDPEYNVLGAVESVSFDRGWRIQSLGNDNRNFRATLDLRLVRYDELGDPFAPSVKVPFQLRLSLVDDLGNTVALAEPGSGIESFTESMAPRLPRSTLPFTTNRSLSVSFRPVAQLDSVNRRYGLKAELWAPPAPKSTRSEKISENTPNPVLLLDYNGSVQFSFGATAVTTVMTDAVRSGSTVVIQPGYLEAYLNITGLSLSANGASYSGSPGLLNLRLLPDGLATYSGSTSFTMSNPAGSARQRVSSNGLTYLLGSQLTLGGSGASGDVIARLPAGMGITTSNSLPGSTTFLYADLLLGAGVVLNNQLTPFAAHTVNYEGGAWVVEETKPVWVGVSSVTVQPSTGRIDLEPTGEVHHPESAMRQQLADAPAGLPDREKRSNSDYWLLATGVNTSEPAYVRQSPRDPEPGSNAALNIEFEVGGGSFKTHFPEAAVSVGASGNPLRIEDDLVVSAESYLGSATLNVSYLAGDPDASPTACGGAGVKNRGVMLRPATTSNRLQFTPTGGLKATCATALTNGHELKWGFLGGEQFAFASDAFQFVGFYMPGTFYPQGGFGTGDSESVIQETPVPMHLCGHVDGTWRFEDMEEPGTAAYRHNSLRADYAGINLRVANEADGFQGHSIISGQDAGSYPLKDQCRYYARKSGVTGIHDAFGGPTGASLYGFATSFTSYGVSFRDCRAVDSVTHGELVVPEPADFRLPLEEIRFTSTGRPLDARLPTGIEPRWLSYWNCTMFPSAVAFASNDPCDASQGRMLIQAGIDMPSLGETLYGELAFLADGRIDHGDHGDSRLKAPNHVAIRGPARPTDEGAEPQFESYTLTPVTDVYLNDHTGNNATSPSKGFLNLAGKLDVAFFEDLEVHVQTSAGGSTAPIYMTGGWTDDQGRNFFDNPDNFDPTNRGFPEGVDLATYRAGGDNGEFRPHALRSWMDVIDFDYPLQWDDATRAFRSADDFKEDVDLLLFRASHRLEHLSAEEAHLRFGLTYEGIPEINLGGMLVNEIDEATGVLAAIEAALEDYVGPEGNGAGAVLYAGSDAMAGLLNDSFDELFGPVIEELLSDVVKLQVLEKLATSTGSLIAPGTNGDAWETALEDGLTKPNFGVRLKLKELGTAVENEASPLTDEMVDAIDEALAMIDVFLGQDGLLEYKNGEYQVAGRLAFELIDQLAPEDLKDLLGIKPGSSAFDEINEQVTKYVAKYAPALDTIRLRLEQLRTQLEDVRQQLDLNGELAKYLEQLFIPNPNPDNDELTLLTGLLVDDMMSHLQANYAGSRAAFANAANREATAAFLIRRVRDRLAAGAIAAGVQKLAREQLQDLQAAIDQTIGSAFSQINRAIRDVIAEAAGALDDAVEPLNGALSQVAGAGSIDGYAVIRGDRLDHLRLDAKLELTLDEPMTFQGYLEFNQLRGGPYGDAREIEVGAIDVPIEMFDTEAEFTIIGRIILGTYDGVENVPLSLGGSIEMAQGHQLEFESFIITDLGAAMQFGVSENYFAAKLGMEFESFRVAGGLFVGHSNTLAPLELVDPDVAKAIKLTSITGVYAYGEVFMPIVDLSCMFKVSAGLGIGAFYFTEGPTYGGKIYAAIQGEALCAIKVRGEVVMIGVKSDIFRFQGKGKIEGKVGKCPFCLKFSKNVRFTYDENNGFDAKW